MSARKPRRRPLLALLTSVTAIAILATGCSATPATGGDAETGERVDGGTLEVYTASDPTRDPRQNHGWVGRLLADSLLDRDPETLEYKPWLAEDWDVNEDSSVFTFYLREGVTFSNGEDVNAEAVKLSIDAGLTDIENGSGLYLYGLFDNYVGTEVVDEYTVTVTFSSTNSAFLAFTPTSFLAVLAPASWDNTLEERSQGEFWGSGPYTLESYTPDSGLVLQRREDYDWASEVSGHTGKASIETINVTTVPEASVREEALRSGDADLIFDPTSLGITSLEAEGFQLNHRSQVGISQSLVWSFQRSAGQDPVIRQAVQKAINREELSTAVGGEHQPPATSVISSVTEGAIDLSEELEFDLEGAIALLEADGWVEGADGIREKDGERLTLTGITWAGQVYEDTLSLIKDQLLEAGIEFIPTFDSNWHTNDEWNTGLKYDLLLQNLTGPDPFILRKGYQNSNHEFEPWLYSDSAEISTFGTELETSLQAILTETGDERLDAIATAQEIIVKDAIRIPLLESQVYVSLSSPNLHGVYSNSISETVLYSAWLSED